MVVGATAAAAETPLRTDTLERLCERSVAPRVEAIGGVIAALAAGTEDAAWAQSVLNAANSKGLFCAADAGPLVKDGDAWFDAATLAPAEPPASRMTNPFVNLRVRASLDMGVAMATLMAEPGSPAASTALEAIERRPDRADLDLLAAAAALPANAALAERLLAAKAALQLRSDDPSVRIDAIALLAESPSARTRTALINLQTELGDTADAATAEALDAAIGEVDFWIGVGNVASTVFSGLSYASILFMASLGLAIIFGLMGVINLAQGEL
ncbi:MAG: hypothetical protein AAF684_00735, partial [Pseudomonadota bacterium]